MNWLKYAEIEKKGSRWEVSFRFTDDAEFVCHQLPVDEFVGYARSQLSAHELAREWLIKQAEMTLYQLEAWPDLKRGPCPHCNNMVEWDRILVNERRPSWEGDDHATWRFTHETAPHFEFEIEYWRKPYEHFTEVEDFDVWLFECRECGGHVQ
jgi:hypothetical protein